jgi:two-component system, chemotaxis family, chemotaxis protein CheY
LIRRVLVVDDSQLLHKMYDLVLRRYSDRGTGVLHAFDGVQALQLLGQFADIDLILLDVNMPTMSGLEFLRRRRSDALVSRIAVIMISTEGKEHDAQAAMAEGAQAYLTKPFHPANLHQKIEELFPSCRSGESANG